MGRKPFRVIVAGGGTGGHVIPAIAIANELERLIPSAEIVFVGARGRMEMELVPAAGFPIVGLPIAGWQRRWTGKNLLIPFQVAYSVVKSIQVLQRVRPHVAVGVGGYASLPVGLAAAILSVPMLIHEQNAYAGIANRLLGRFAKKICVAYEGMHVYFPAQKLVYTGNPVRRDLLKKWEPGEAKRFFGFSDAWPVVLVLGGSLGATAFNQFVEEQLDTFKQLNIQLLWQTGTYDWQRWQRKAEPYSPTIKAVPFIDRMDLAYACADVVVSRAGALAITELAATAKACILIPSPNVAEDHQTRNARVLVQAGAAIMVAEQAMKHELLPRLHELLTQPAVREQMQNNIRAFARPHAGQQIAQHIIELAPHVSNHNHAT